MKQNHKHIACKPTYHGVVRGEMAMKARMIGVAGDWVVAPMAMDRSKAAIMWQGRRWYAEEDEQATRD